MSTFLLSRYNLIMASLIFSMVFFVGGIAGAASVVTSTTTKEGTVSLSASADGPARTVTLPCADGSVRQCQSDCIEGTCSLIAAWKAASGREGSFGSFSFPMQSQPSPGTSAHQWCLALVNSMGSPLGSGGSAGSTVRTFKKNGVASVNGFSCPTALESGVFEPAP